MPQIVQPDVWQLGSGEQCLELSGAIAGLEIPGRNPLPAPSEFRSCRRARAKPAWMRSRMRSQSNVRRNRARQAAGVPRPFGQGRSERFR
jgi:hypothetical protein